MTNYASWQPIYRAMCPEPGPRDLFVVILINGKRVGLHPVEEYERWRAAAQKLACEHECQVKVLPMGGHELLAFSGVEPAAPQPVENMDPAFRAQAVKNCHAAIVECDDARLRQDALDLLRALGAMQ
jgi:hypothetical protein